jgi:Flp pilus assembly protein TadD
VDDRQGPTSARDIVRRHLERASQPSQFGSSASAHQTYRVIINSYAPGETILPAQARTDCLGLVVRGRVSVHPRSRWDSWPSVVLRPGQTFGQAMLVQGRPSGETVRALTRSEVWFVRSPSLGALPKEDPFRRPPRPVWLRLLGIVLLASGLLAALMLNWSPLWRVSSLVFMGVGQWCSELGYDTCAERAWTAAATLTPADAHPRLALGNLYAMRGELAAAEANLEQAKDLLPGSAEVLNNLGFLFAERGEHERALGLLRQASEFEPGNAVIEHNLGRSLQAVGARDEALLHYQISVALAGPRASSLANMAIAYYERGQPTKAAQAASEAIRYDNTLAPAHAVLGAVALEGEQPEKAILHLHRALSLDPRLGPAYLLLGLAYRDLGQSDEAAAALRRALRYAGDRDMRLRVQQLLDQVIHRQGADLIP